MKSKTLFIVAIMGALAALGAWSASAQTNLAQKLSGRILLQVETRGQAWYVNPTDQKRYYLGRPLDALTIMGRLGLGINNANLDKIQVGLLNYQGTDDDADGLPNSLEQALGLDGQKADTDNDGYNDKLEIINNYNPLGQGKILTDKNLMERLRGKILLQVENRGAGWYLNPVDNKKYYLGKPQDGWQVMSGLALGITDNDLEQITMDQPQSSVPIDQPPATPPPDQPLAQESALDQAASNIRSNNSNKAQAFFTESMRKSIEYSLKHLSSESRLLLANLLSGAKLTNSSETEKIYSTKAYFSLGGYDVPLNFRVQKQPNDTWLIANL